jgi:hypothetical protein
MQTSRKSDSGMKPRCLLILHSYHHDNTGKIARAMAKELDAQVCGPGQMDIDGLA